MPIIHPNTTLDPEAEAVALVTKLEFEALDEDMVHGALAQAITVLQSRQQVALERVNEETARRTIDNRNAKVKAKVKGVTPATFGGQRVRPVSVIPSRH